MPILDGSAKFYIDSIQENNIIELNQPKKRHTIHDVIEWKDEQTGAEYIFLPHEDFSVTCLIDFPSKMIKHQYAVLNDIKEYAEEIGTAKTFCFLHEIEFLYSRALDVRTDLSTSEELKKKTRSLLKDVTTYAKTSQNLKRIELQPLLANLGGIYKKHTIAYKAALKEQGNTKDIAAISTIPEYQNLVFSTPEALNAYAKETSTKENSSSLLKTSKYKNLSNEVDNDLNGIADPVFERGPQAITQDLACKDGKKICASVGEPGNMIGKIFPPGVWAFTYDDGPSPAITTKIMDHFINYKDSQNPIGKATFFWTAFHFDPKNETDKELEANSAMIKKAVANGFAIANHSYDHADLNKSSTDRKKQINT